jgi:hypothetical protein
MVTSKKIKIAPKKLLTFGVEVLVMVYEARKRKVTE